MRFVSLCLAATLIASLGLFSTQAEGCQGGGFSVIQPQPVFAQPFYGQQFIQPQFVRQRVIVRRPVGVRQPGFIGRPGVVGRTLDAVFGPRVIVGF